MRLSLFNQGQWYMEEKHGEHDWVGNGPGVDAMAEPTLRDALEHIAGCCSVVLENWEDAEGWPDPELPDNYEWIPETQDKDLLEYVEHMILYTKGEDHPWMEEIQRYQTLAALAEEVQDV